MGTTRSCLMLTLSPGGDLVYLQTGISRVLFGVLNFENLYLFGCWSQLLYFLVIK